MKRIYLGHDISEKGFVGSAGLMVQASAIIAPPQRASVGKH